MRVETTSHRNSSGTSEALPADAAPRAVAVDREPTTGEWLLRSFLRSSLLFTLYVLSIGPLYWQWYGSRYAGESPVVGVIFEPLVILAEWIPPFGAWLDWYVRLWIG